MFLLLYNEYVSKLRLQWNDRGPTGVRVKCVYAIYDFVGPYGYDKSIPDRGEVFKCGTIVPGYYGFVFGGNVS